MNCFRYHKKKEQSDELPYYRQETTSSADDWYLDTFCNYSKRPTMMEKIQERTSMTQEIRPKQIHSVPQEKMPPFPPRDVLHPIYPQLSYDK